MELGVVSVGKQPLRDYVDKEKRGGGEVERISDVSGSVASELEDFHLNFKALKSF